MKWEKRLVRSFMIFMNKIVIAEKIPSRRNEDINTCNNKPQEDQGTGYKTVIR